MTAPDDVELNAATGLIAPELAAEFPGLRLHWLSASGRNVEICPIVELATPGGKVAARPR